MVHVRRNAIALSTAFVASPAFGWAADVPVRFCFVHVTSFTDAYDPVDGLPPLGDDYFLDSIMDVPARGVKGRVIDVGTPTEPGFNEVWSDFAYEDGSHVGCTPLLSIKEGHLVSVHTYTRAKIGSNSIRLTNDALEVFWFATSLDETVDQTWAAEPVTIPATGYLTPHSNIMAASEWALYSHDGGLANEEYSFVLTADECFGNACALLDTVYISPATADYKWTIVHEMGHALSVKADQHLPFAIFYEADPGICADAGPGSHFIISKEFQSAAAPEGFAHLYAAITFNNEGESDCRMERSYSVDWDRSGPPSDGPQFSCTGSPDADAPSVDEKNYLQDWCDGSTYVRGTEYDWLRFFWGEIPATLDFDSLVEIWDLADPHHWCPTDAPTPFPHLPWEIPPPPAHLGPCYPSDRIMAAASLVLDPTFEFPFFAGHAEQHGVSTGFWAW